MYTRRHDEDRTGLSDFVRFEGERPQLSENAHAPPLGCQGFNDAVEIDDERLPALLWSLRSQALACTESALPPKPDINNERRHVRFGPDSDTRFVIRSPSSRLRAAPAAREAKRLGGLEVDNQFVHGRSLNWQDGCLLALEDTIDAAGRLLV